MPGKKQDFLGKDIADAIKNACEALDCSQEKLDIEIVDTGSTGIFGLIRKKAKIRASIKNAHKVKLDQLPVTESSLSEAESGEISKDFEPNHTSEPDDKSLSAAASDDEEEQEDFAESVAESVDDTVEISDESCAAIKADLERLTSLMGFDVSVAVQSTGQFVECTLTGDNLEELIGAEGKTIDSIQYLIRKIAARKCPERLRISLNAGDFRERRLQEIKQLAIDLAAQVKLTGKTQIIAALNPSERREVHIILQDEKEIRSRSVGEGLFKKILIYKPGKGSNNGRRKSGSTGRNSGAGRSRRPAPKE